MTPAQRENFRRLLQPRQIAFVGGTDAAIAIGEAARRGYQGDIWPVNPKRSEMGGHACFASLEDLPSTPDAVFLAIPAAGTTQMVQDLSRMGVGGVVCYAAGFREAGGNGRALETALQTAAGDMVLVGPNCYGVINYLDNVAMWPFAHGGTCPGYGAAIVTQSGMFSSDITMSQRSLPLTHMISAGNQTVMGLPDYMDVLCELEEVRAIGLHIEGLQDVPDFERAALKAMAHNTPVVAFKTGRSSVGSALTESHTGSLSGSNELYDALFDRCGIVPVDSPSQFIETLKYLCIAGAPKGNRISGFTCSGGGATMLADYSETIDLCLPAFDAEARERLQKRLPAIATVSNPLDYTTPIWGQPELTGPVFSEALTSSRADAALLVQDYPAPGLDELKDSYLADARAFSEAAKQAGIPAAICATIHENIDADTRAFMIEEGVAPIQGIHEALNAIGHGAYWSSARDRIMETKPAPLVPVALPDRIEAAVEAEAKALLRAAGLETPNGAVVSGKEAVAAAQKLTFPVALKMQGPRLSHKTEAGAIALGLDSLTAVENAVQNMKSAVRAFDAAAVTDSFLVEKMARPPVAELLVSIRRDAQFGMAMTIGAGGTQVELMQDAATVLLPASSQDISRAINRLKTAPLLRGFRGKPEVDIERLAKTLHQFAAQVLQQSESIVEIEINPLFVYQESVLAVDALIFIAKH